MREKEQEPGAETGAGAIPMPAARTPEEAFATRCAAIAERVLPHPARGRGVRHARPRPRPRLHRGGARRVPQHREGPREARLREARTSTPIRNCLIWWRAETLPSGHFCGAPVNRETVAQIMNNLLAFSSASTRPRVRDDKICRKTTEHGRHCGHSHHRGLVGGHGRGLRPPTTTSTIIPMTIAFGSEQFAEGVDLSREEFFERLVETDELPRTSQIPPMVFQDLFQEAVDRGQRGRLHHALQPHLRHLPERLHRCGSVQGVGLRGRQRERHHRRAHPRRARLGPARRGAFRRRHRLLPQPGKEGHPARGFPGHAGVSAPRRPHFWSGGARGRHALHQARGGRRRWRRRGARQGARLQAVEEHGVPEDRRGRRHRLHTAHLGGLLGPVRRDGPQVHRRQLGTGESRRRSSRRRVRRAGRSAPHAGRRRHRHPRRPGRRRLRLLRPGIKRSLPKEASSTYELSAAATRA